MLSDSKVRQAGFIRNSSSKKIIYQQEEKKQNSSSDDSFSSFEYENTSKVSIASREVPIVNKSKQKPQLIANKSLPPQIPPKPMKKPQQQFQNQRLKNNFFQQKEKNSSQQNSSLNGVKKSIPRTNTPQFCEEKLKKDIQAVQNVCNRIQNMKLEGNFSFNPKMNKLKMNDLEQQRQKYEFAQQLTAKTKQQQRPTSSNVYRNQAKPQVPAKYPKQNNYFHEQPSNKFQYDFDQSSQEQQEPENVAGNYPKQLQDSRSGSQSSSESQVQEQQFDQNQAMKYYQQQQRRKFQQIQQKQVKNIHSGNVGNRTFQQQPPKKYRSKQTLGHIVSKKVENQQQDDQELITEYKKTQFGNKISENIKRRQLAQNRAYQNQQLLEQQGFVKTHGGVCFEVDVKQFSQNPSTIDYNPPRRAYYPQKKKKVNQKEQILKRRENAKIYSKQARFRLFGFS